MIETLLLVGATGDLAGRYLFPALGSLIAAEKLPSRFRVVGTAQADMDDEMFRRHVEERLDRHAADVPGKDRATLVRSLSYRPVDLGDPGSVAAVLDRAREASEDAPVGIYLALPPSVFPPALRSLGAAGVPPGSRVAIEKPFGEDLAGARALNELSARAVGDQGEQAVFRVDHVLGMATTTNLLHLRFANRSLEALWNSDNIEQVDILWEETIALEGRAGFYDNAGALKDVMQNHMLQILSFVAMEPPASLDDEDLRDAKVDALRSVRDMTQDEVVARTRRARYGPGRLARDDEADGSSVPAYADEDGVDATRGAETFAEVMLEIENERWAGTRFLLRAGKAMAARRKGVVIHFRRSTLPMFSRSSEMSPNALWIGIDGPADISWHLSGGAAGRLAEPRPVVLSGEPPASELPAYGHVLLDFLTAGSTLSVRGDEAEEAWRVVEPVLEAWSRGRVPLLEYPAGSDGP